ncbi:sulfate adenylyltransferase [Streptomyces sp. NA04227]|nr:sulfate adenylyltransferase [Streptomyces sp. NA04227]
MRLPGFFATFAKEGGRVGSGALGSGQGGVARCAG